MRLKGTVSRELRPLVFLESSFLEYLLQTKKLLATCKRRHFRLHGGNFFGGMSLAERLERLTDNTKVATVLGSIPASSDTVKSEGRQNNVHKNQNVE